MGYTHYYKKNKPTNNEEWGKFTNEVMSLKKALPREIKLADWDGYNKPTINQEYIVINGKYPNNHESLNIGRKDVSSFEFTKTNRNPYDIMVLAVLISAYRNIEGFYIKSDGINLDLSFDTEFTDAVDFYNKVIKPEQPFTTDEFIAQLKYFEAS